MTHTQRPRKPSMLAFLLAVTLSLMPTAGVTPASAMRVPLGLTPALAIDLPEGAKVGDAAPDFVLLNTDGKRVGLASYAEAKGIILVFTCNTCPYALKYEDRVVALNEKYSKAGFPVVAINSNDTNIVPEDSPEHMRKRVAEKNFKFPYLFDETQDVAKAYGARKTPHVYVLQRTVRGFSIEYIGAIDDDPDQDNAFKTKYVEGAIEALLGSAKPAVTFTKAIGCTIKWKKS